jgi:hypothetical protein
VLENKQTFSLENLWPKIHHKIYRVTPVKEEKKLMRVGEIRSWLGDSRFHQKHTERS